MKLVVLIGLVSIEKIYLTVELAQLFGEQGKTVTVIDNVARLALDSELLAGDEQLIRLNGDLRHYLQDTLEHIEADIVLIAASETSNLDDLFMHLETICQMDAISDIQTIGLVDLRTCDCFPNLRMQLESYVDVSFLAPFDAQEVWEQIT